jgi:hypothetical protein
MLTVVSVDSLTVLATMDAINEQLLEQLNELLRRASQSELVDHVTDITGEATAVFTAVNIF